MSLMLVLRSGSCLLSVSVSGGGTQLLTCWVYPDLLVNVLEQYGHFNDDILRVFYLEIL